MRRCGAKAIARGKTPMAIGAGGPRIGVESSRKR